MIRSLVILVSLVPTASAAEPVHWSLRPLAAPGVPTGAAHPIDAFVRARLIEKKLTPSPEADRRTVIRRLTYNLHGLPPTPAELADFLADRRPDAYERLVDRLLASPRYGERWARHWMDIAHFAETHGHDQDAIRENAWPYRDYLIQSFNADKPYARFVQEQIAGDALFPDDPRAIVALGFLAAGPWDESSQKDIRDDTLDKKAAQYLDRDDMITTAFTAFASTSIHCARCHDHKFDPIAQAEYYGLQAVFAGVDRANREYDADPVLARKRKALAGRRAGVADGKIDLASEGPIVEQWERDAIRKTLTWSPLAVTVTAKESKGVPQADGSILFSGPRPERDTYTCKTTAPIRLTAIRLEAMTDPSLPHQGPGRQDNGNLHLNEVRVFANGQAVRITQAFADFNQSGWDITQAIDGRAETAWGIFGAVGKPHEAVFVLKEPIPAGAAVTVELQQTHGEGHLLGRIRLSGTSEARPSVAAKPLPGNITAILKTDRAKRTAAQANELARYALLDWYDEEIARLPKPTAVYAAASEFARLGSFQPARGPRPIHMLRRGEITRPGAEALPGTIACVAGPRPLAVTNVKDEGERRAALARWMTDPANGLVWRSIVNRVWHYHFGRGIVATPNDFGKMGAPPSHPELLEWLAVWFRDGGGSLKDLHRFILTSATYRQVSSDRMELALIDKDNQYLWRMNRQRLDAESVRDAILATSGMLDLTMGGPSARQFGLSPGVHVTPKVEYEKYNVDSPAARRRSVYRFIFRTIPDPFFESLDCPDASQLVPVRPESMTALQALTLLNDRFAVRYAEHLAERLESEVPDRPGQVRRAFELVLSRSASEAETKRVADYAGRHGLANACRVLFNSNEFMFVD